MPPIEPPNPAVGSPPTPLPGPPLMLKGFPAAELIGRVPVLSRANTPSVAAMSIMPAAAVVTIEKKFMEFFIVDFLICPLIWMPDQAARP